MNALTVRCPNPECTGPVAAKPVRLLADLSSHPLAPLLSMVNVGGTPPWLSLSVSALALAVSPILVLSLGLWAAPLAVIMALGLILEIAALALIPRTGAVTLTQYKCKRCRYTWIKNEGSHEPYLRRLEWSLARARGKQNKRVLASTLSDMGGLLMTERGDLTRALPLLEESYAMRSEQNDVKGLAYTRNNLAFALVYAGRFQEARSLGEQSVAAFRASGEWRGLASASHTLAAALIGLGEVDSAGALLNESLQIKWKMADQELAAWDLEGLAEIALAQGEAVRAARLLGAAQGLREAAGVSLMPLARARVERTVYAARAALGETQLASAWAEGRHMTLDQACDYALYARDVTPISLPLAR